MVQPEAGALHKGIYQAVTGHALKLNIAQSLIRKDNSWNFPLQRKDAGYQPVFFIYCVRKKKAICLELIFHQLSNYINVIKEEKG
jgi:hypothetical protein